MRLLVYVALTAALATPAYSHPGSWQRRVSRRGGAGRSTKKAVIIGAIGWALSLR